MASMEKRLLRQVVRRQISALPPEYLRRAGGEISARLVRLQEYRRAKTVLAFASAAGEPDLLPFLRHILQSGKYLALPVCTAPGCMEVRITESLDVLRPGRYRILEPGPECPAPAEINFAAIPCLACDRFGNRLGHGGGYYDRYLAQHRPFTVLVCPEALLQPSIPTEPLDQSVRLVVTERGFYQDGEQLPDRY